ncbi:hypothetical protein BDQ17DRAFT_1332788 [Cyathus striatus]|nr:hypothetical protein BDQ17DRAFT_1332788 [Cyathus striatus]
MLERLGREMEDGSLAEPPSPVAENTNSYCGIASSVLNLGDVSGSIFLFLISPSISPFSSNISNTHFLKLALQLSFIPWLSKKAKAKELQNLLRLKLYDQDCNGEQEMDKDKFSSLCFIDDEGQGPRKKSNKIFKIQDQQYPSACSEYTS